MNKRNTMPSRKRIFNYWVDRIDGLKDDNTCFKCGFTLSDCTAVERCHIKPHWRGGNEDESNLHLLCSECHIKSEIYEDNIYWFWFEDRSKSHSHFQIRLASNLYFNKIDHELMVNLKEDIKVFADKFENVQNELKSYLY